MAVKINGGRRDDDRVQRILRAPAAYFAEARRRARDEVRQEMADEQRLSAKRDVPAT